MLEDVEMKELAAIIDRHTNSLTRDPIGRVIFPKSNLESYLRRVVNEHARPPERDSKEEEVLQFADKYMQKHNWELSPNGNWYEWKGD